ncbi:SDR family oxidoreductase [Mangrovibacillus cuniculi]|uniref:SDR family oxidoreductase n=1 Tax=Mangrovibacillus cuniculi TaxID=2593652 RepID=A0A7S8HGY2_9BACI|nr:SDR family oxidoreductase [Mangrovibacillus cuniculi]QPC48383.1 SDR family oxidoreductase [Mangrovibacillus cuniculi]
MNRRTAFITGGAKGLGKVTAERLAQEGYNVIVNYRNSKEEAQSLINQLRETYDIRAFSIKGDMTVKDDILHVVEEIKEQVGVIDVLVHNAGPYIKERKKLTDYTDDEWNELINGNLTSAFYLFREILPLMRKQNFGRVITFGYDRVDTTPGWIYRSAFASAKAGLASLTRTIALEEAEYGITCNMICPGDILPEWKESTISSAMEVDDKSIPVGRPGTGEDIARVVSFLCNEAADFITGSIIPVTGGKDVLGKIYHQQ